MLVTESKRKQQLISDELKAFGSTKGAEQVENFYKACEFLKENNFNYQQYLIEEDSHTISLKAIDLLQEFIKKNL